MNKEKLLKVIEKVNPAVSGGGLVEQSNTILFNKNEVKTYNEEILITIPIKTGIKGGVPAKELYTLLQKMKDKKIELKQVEGGVRITGESTKVLLKINNVKFPDMSIPTKWKTLPKDFTKGLKFCRFSVTEQTNILNNVLVKGDRVLSCDNYRITEYIIKGNIKECLIPSTVINNLISFEPISMSFNKSWLCFKNSDGAIFCIRKVVGKYPDIEPALKVEKGTKLSLPDELKDSLERTRILSSEDLATGNRLVNVLIKDNKIRCHGECEVGQIDETIPIEYSGKKISFDIVPDFLFEILTKTKNMLVCKSSLRFKSKGFQHIVQLIKE